MDRRPLEVFRNRTLKLTSRPGESQDDFRARCDRGAQAEADKETAKVTARLQEKQHRLRSALAVARRRVQELEAETKIRASDEMVAGAGAVLGAILGGRRSTRSITTAIRGASSRRGATARSAERRKTAQDKVIRTTGDLRELEQEILDEVAAIDADWRAKAEKNETVSIRAEATDITVVQLALVWVPTLGAPAGG